MEFLTWIAVGLVAGLLAQFVLRGGPGGIGPRRLVITVVVGVVGAIVGGFFSTMLGFWDVTGFNIRSLIVAASGAIVVIAAWRVLLNGRGRPWAL